MAIGAIKFTAEITGVGIRYVKRKIKSVVVGVDPVCVVTLKAVDGDEHDLADAIGGKVGQRVKVSLSLEQTELDEG